MTRDDGKRNVGREMVIIAVATLVLGGGFAAYMVNTMPSAEDLKSHMTAPPSQTQTGPSLQDRASAVVRPFVAALGRSDHAAAYALMAAPYKNSASLESFTNTCKASPHLSQAREVGLFKVSQRSIPLPDGKLAQGPVNAEGLLVSSQGNVDATFVLAQEGDDLRVLTILAAGVPLLQGVSAPPPAMPSVTPSATP